VPTKSSVGNIEPGRLYSFAELAEVTGLTERIILRLVDEESMGCVKIGDKHGRRVEGQQYLDWKASRRRDPVAV
jgi:hypothetical protein